MTISTRDTKPASPAAPSRNSASVAAAIVQKENPNGSLGPSLEGQAGPQRKHPLAAEPDNQGAWLQVNLARERGAACAGDCTHCLCHGGYRLVTSSKRADSDFVGDRRAPFDAEDTLIT